MTPAPKLVDDVPMCSTTVCPQYEPFRSTRGHYFTGNCMAQGIHSVNDSSICRPGIAAQTRELVQLRAASKTNAPGMPDGSGESRES